MEARKLKLVVPQINVVPSLHHRESADWARPPRLKTVVDLRSARRERRASAFAGYVFAFLMGYCLHMWAVS